MREVYSNRDSSQVGFYKSVLDAAEIPAFIRNESGSFNGDGPLFFPALCVIDDDDFDEAIKLITARQSSPALGGADWKCASCSEFNPPNFELCWNCQSARPRA